MFDNDSDIESLKPITADNIPFCDMEVCGLASCKICPFIQTSPRVNGYIQRRTFLANRPAGCSCSTKGIIYVITCTKCGMQYVGMTKRSLKARISEHLRNIKNKRKDTFLYKHFCRVDHSNKDFEVTILDKVNDNSSFAELQARSFLDKSVNYGPSFWVQ